MIMEESKFNVNSSPCTSIEQSKRLLALGLKKETADMKYHGLYLSSVDKWYNKEYPEVLYDGEQIHGKDIPAWSLHRLIEMMPTTIKSRYGYVNLTVNAELVQYQYYDEDYMHNECCQHFNDGTLYDNIIDCIEWLIKEGYFNKEYLER